MLYRFALPFNCPHCGRVTGYINNRNIPLGHDEEIGRFEKGNKKDSVAGSRCGEPIDIKITIKIKKGKKPDDSPVD